MVLGLGTGPHSTGSWLWGYAMDRTALGHGYRARPLDHTALGHGYRARPLDQILMGNGLAYGIRPNSGTMSCLIIDFPTTVWPNLAALMCTKVHKATSFPFCQITWNVGPLNTTSRTTLEEHEICQAATGLYPTKIEVNLTLSAIQFLSDTLVLLYMYVSSI